MADRTARFIAWYMNLGNVLQAVGDLPGAQNCFERAVRIDEATFSGHHPNVARDAHALGGVLLQVGDLAGARDHFERTVHILLKFLETSTQTLLRC